MSLTERPRVSVISSRTPPTVKKGDEIIIQCLPDSDYNEAIDSFIWSHDGQVLPITTKKIQFEMVKIKDAGKYICTVKNRAGEDSSDITVIVTCE